MTIQEAAQITGRSPATIRRGIKAGRIPARLLPGPHGPYYDILPEALGAPTTPDIRAHLDRQTEALLLLVDRIDALIRLIHGRQRS